MSALITILIENYCTKRIIAESLLWLGHQEEYTCLSDGKEVLIKPGIGPVEGEKKSILEGSFGQGAPAVMTSYTAKNWDENHQEEDFNCFEQSKQNRPSVEGVFLEVEIFGLCSPVLGAITKYEALPGLAGWLGQISGEKTWCFWEHEGNGEWVSAEQAWMIREEEIQKHFKRGLDF